jgi:hypothetical protein
MLSKLVLVLMIVMCARPAMAYTPEEVKRGYEWCMKYLELPRAEQARIAQANGYSLSHALSSCRFDRDRGLKQLLADEREYQRQQQ